MQQEVNIPTLIQYYRSCYQADQREQNIWNIFDKKKVEHLHFFPGEEEILNQQIPYRYLDEEVAETTLKTLKLFRKEKQLYYYAFFIGGAYKNTEITTRKRITAPLLYYPAEIFEQEGTWFFQVDFTKQQVNYPLLSALDNIDNESYEQALFDALPSGKIDYGDYQDLIKALSPYLTDVNFQESYRYPEEMMGEAQLKKATQRKSLYLLPATCLGVMTTSKNTRGVLNELAEIAQQTTFSQPLHQLFEPSKPVENKTLVSKKILVPTLLSVAQKAILATAQTEAISQVTGPPGTGKSYTIASLAIDAMQRGESVLIASRNHLAVDVIQQKIEEQLGSVEGLLVRGGSRTYLSELKKFLDNLLAGIGVPNREEAFEADKVFSQTFEKLEQLKVDYGHLHTTFHTRAKKELKYASYIIRHRQATHFFHKWWYAYQKWRIQKYLSKNTPIWKILLALQTTLRQKHKYLRLYIKLKYQRKLRDLIQLGRPTLMKFLKSIRARRDAKQEALLKSIDFSVILQALPIWLVNITDIYDILPLKKELFDIAVIDEASQSDIASALPILYRAKRVVVVGDTKQLRHISFLSRAKQTKLQEDLQLSHYDTFKLNYREQSILDIVHYSLQKQSQIHLLNEHFRSLPDIIQFSNQYFYNNALHIMTQNLHNQAKKGLVLVQQSGERDKKGHNPSEAQFIIDRIKAIIKQETSLTQQVCHSIGVLSPFRDQVDYLSKTIKAQFSLEQITKHQIEVGTAYSFQGNERDIMFISWVVDKQSTSGSFSYLNKEDVFNVSITRARVKQYILISIAPKLLKQESILAAYISYLVTSQQKKPVVSTTTTNALPSFGEEVAMALRAEGFHCEIGYFIAGLEVDLVIQKGNKHLGIDLVGYPDDHLAVFTIERYQILQRAGLSVLPIPYTRWYFDQAACVTAIKEAFEG